MTATQTSLTLLGVTVTLEPVPGVFTPTPHGLFYANATTVRPGERVIDIGTGSGVLAIAAAKLGAQVVATDVNAAAVRAAEHNAALNGVKVEGHVGRFFADVSGTFDVILANLPNEIVVPEYLAKLIPEEAGSIDGGPAGNAAILGLLDASLPYMHARSRLYLPVSGLTDYKAVIRAAESRYVMRLVATAPIGVKEFVTEHLEFYEELAERQVIQLFNDPEAGWQTWEYAYECSLPAS